jgi:hypothetical protein
MSDWEFLHDMNNEGCSTGQLLEAMATGGSPHNWVYIEKQEKKAKWKKLKSLRDSGEISKEEFKKRKNEIFE